MRLRLLLVALALLTVACSPDGQDLMDAFVASIVGEKPLTDPDNPQDVQAAGATAEAAEHDEDAQTQIGRALRPGKTTEDKIRHAENAVVDRPDDPLYWLYLARFHDENKDGLSTHDAVAEAGALIAGQFAHIEDPVLKAKEESRRFLEVSMEAVLVIYHAAPEGSAEKTSLQDEYCHYRKHYRQHREGFYGSAYWDFTVNHDLCR